MVLPDWSRPSRSASSAKSVASTEKFEEFQLGRPLDRLAASIIDFFVVLAPVYVLISAPLKRWLTESYILGSEPDFLVTISLMIFIGVALLVFYQSLAYYFFATSLGKRLFDLKVVSVFEEPAGFWQFAARSIVWILELMLLGLPWLAVFSNPKRRPLHDRVSDTIVVSATNSGVPAPMSWERSLVTSFFVMFLSLTSLSFLVQLYGVFEKIRVEDSVAALLEKESGHCDVVDAHTPQDTDNKLKAENSRLKLAMVLYAAGLADRSCLEAEVEREMGLQIPVAPVTYLAQAFVYADDAEVSNAYLDEVCEVAADSVECAMSRMVSAWSDEDWMGVEEIVASSPMGSGYLEIWGVRHYMKQAKYENALNMLDTLLSRKEIKDFNLVQRVKALQSSYREAEASVAYQQALAALADGDSRDLSAWMCSHQLQSGCGAMEALACRQMQKPDLESMDYERAPEALAQIMALECKSQADYIKLSEGTRDDSWQMFFRANLKRQRDDRSAAAELFKDVIQLEDTPDVLRVEAIRRLSKFASPKQMEQVVEMWSNFESREAWVKGGNILFARLAEQNNADLALKVGRHLLNAKSLSPASLNVLVSMTDTTGVLKRQPASVKPKDQIRNLMNSIEGEP